MKDVSESATPNQGEKKRTNILRLLKLGLIGVLSLLIWLLYFIGKSIEFIKERITNDKW